MSCVVVILHQWQDEETEFCGMEYVKHICHWSTNVLHIACPSESPDFATADILL
jgi:hypothetical protein